MENQNNNQEQMPKAQSMKAVNKNHLILLVAGLVCLLLGSVIGYGPVGDILKIVGIVIACIGLYNAFKHRKATNNLPNSSSSEDEQ